MIARPEVGAPTPWSFPTPERATLANGLDVLTIHLPGQYVVSAGLSIDLPLSAEPAALEGVASLTVRTLDEGTLDHPGPDFAEAVERCGAELQGAVGLASTQLWLDVPASRLAEALPLLAEAVSRPTLADADVERHRTIRLAQIEQELATSPGRAAHAFRQAVVADSLRAARMADGEAATVASVTGADARAFHATHYVPGRATLVIAGDLSGAASDPVALADAAFSAWSGTATPTQHERLVGKEPRAYLVDRPGSVQADVRWGALTIDRGDPRWPHLVLATHAVGGAFNSRLNRVLREEKGYTYGASLTSTPLRHGGLTAVAGSFRNEVVGDALALIPRLVDVADDPLTASEIDDARRYLLGVGPLQYSTAAGVCHGLLAWTSAGVGPGFVNRLRAAFAEVTPESATSAIAELLPPASAALVVVGDAAVLADGMRRTGFDPVMLSS